jgi:hypothetical protein
MNNTILLQYGLGQGNEVQRDSLTGLDRYRGLELESPYAPSARYP